MVLALQLPPARGRSVLSRFRYAREGVVKREPKARASREVWWHSPPENFYS